MLPVCCTFESIVLKLLLHVDMAIYIYMAGEGLWNSPPIGGIYVSHIYWCITSKEAVRIVLLFRSLWLGTLYKWSFDCAPIFSYTSKLCFCIIYVPILHALSREKINKGLRQRSTAYTYTFDKGPGLRLYVLKR